MKRVLILASVASMIGQFNMGNIRLLQEMGYEVHVACNFKEGSTCDVESVRELEKDLKELHVAYFHVDFSRDMKDIGKHLGAYRQVVNLLGKNGYRFLHCHSPIGGVVGRLAAHRTHTKVVYTAHGFHFYKGAPVKNWLMYFPAEWLCSFWTDLLVTINKEDYSFARKHLHAKRTGYVPGVGIDMKKFSPGTLSPGERSAMRAELGVGPEDKMLLSVGELNRNKNHGIVIKAMAELNDEKLHYVIAGSGGLRGYLEGMAQDLGLSGRVHLLGYSRDVAELYQVADLYIHPSLREGLPVSLMEAIASKCPVICSDIRGNRDLVGVDALFPPMDSSGVARKITEYLSGDRSEEIGRNFTNLRKFDIAEVTEAIEELISAAIP